MTHFTCPHCGKMTSTTMDVYAVDFGGGCPTSYFPAVDLAQGRERHCDTRLCCQDCWSRAGAIPLALGEPHPYSGTAHERRLERAVGTVIGAPR